MSLSIRKGFLLQTLFVSLLLLPQMFGGGQIGLLFTCFIFLMVLVCYPIVIGKDIIYPVLILLFVPLAASFSMLVFHDALTIDIIRDALVMLRPIFYLYIGYILVKNLENKSFIFTAIIYAGLLLALRHIAYVMFNYDVVLSGNINALRAVSGRTSMLEVFAFMFLVSNYKFFNISKLLKITFIFILSLSFVLYFSRTMLLAQIIVFIGLRSGFRFSFKYVWFFLAGAFLVFLSWSFINQMEIDRSSTGFRSVLYKIKIAPSELFSTSFDLENKAELWDRWRSYEAVMAVEEMQDSGVQTYFYGRGLGGTVDLGFYAPLSEEGIRYIPLLHNGFAHVFFKAGVIGLLMYLSFLLYIFKKGRGKFIPRMPIHHLSSNMLLTLVVLIFFTTFAIAGLYNQAEILSLLVGAMLFIEKSCRAQNVTRNNNESSVFMNTAQM